MPILNKMTLQQNMTYLKEEDSKKIFHILGKKWTLQILIKLTKYQTLGFNQMKNHLQNITPPILSSILKELEKHNVIIKKIHNGSITTVSYSLTVFGKFLHEIYQKVKKTSC